MHPTPLREPCQSQACKRGLGVGLRRQPASLCCPAQWRMKLAGGGPSMAVGHSRQLGSRAWPALQPQHQHQKTPNCLHPSPQPLGSLPIILRTLRLISCPSCLFALELKLFNPQHGSEKQGHRGWRLAISCWVRETCCLNQSLFGIPGSVRLLLSRRRARTAVYELWTLWMPEDTTLITFWNVGILTFPCRFISLQSMIKLLSSCLIWTYTKISEVYIYFLENAVMWQHLNETGNCHVIYAIPSSPPLHIIISAVEAQNSRTTQFHQIPKTQAQSFMSVRARSPQS